MLHVVTFILTFLPTVLLMTYFYRRDRNKEPAKVLTGTFLLGLFAFIPVVFVENLFSSFGVLSHANPLVYNLYNMFANVAIPEESFKLLVIVLYSARTRAFDEPMDGIVYGVAAALGFATIENIFYVLGGGLGTAVIRALLSVPSHAFWGAILGYSVAQVRFKGKAKILVLAGLFIAVSLHSIFNYLLITVEGSEAYFGALSGFFILGLLHILFIVFAFEIIWILRTIRRLRLEQDQIAEKKAE
ncbi:MAG: PrsW family intramembrane metalloprotease [Candidatus Sabulitectum sp.]|nr:PrsW family intramembrane metalloprotease [Candidatus Sabulitectum sp.]